METQKLNTLNVKPDVYQYIMSKQTGTDKNVSNTLRRLLHLTNSAKAKSIQKKTKAKNKGFSRRRKKSPKSSHLLLRKNSAPLFCLSNDNELDDDFEDDFGDWGKGREKKKV